MKLIIKDFPHSSAWQQLQVVNSDGEVLKQVNIKKRDFVNPRLVAEFNAGERMSRNLNVLTEGHEDWELIKKEAWFKEVV